MPTTRETISIDGSNYLVPERNVRYDDVLATPPQTTVEAPQWSDLGPFDTYEQDDWSGGAGFFRVSGSRVERDRYASASNVDGSFEHALFLSPLINTAKKTDGTSLGVAITHFVEFKGNLFVFGGTKAFYASAAFPNAFTACGGGDLGATVTDVIVYGGTLFIALGTSTAFVYTTSSTGATWTSTAGAGNAAYAQFWAVLNDTLYRGISATGSSTAVAIYSTTDEADSFTWSGANNVGDKSAALTGLLSFDNGIIVLKEDGIWEFDTNGTSYQVNEEMKKFRSPNNGKYATPFKGMLFFKFREGVSAWSGSQVLGVASYTGSELVGPDALLSDISSTMGTPVAMIGAHPFLYIAVKTPASTYFIKKYDMTKGRGRGVHDWISNGSSAIAGMYYYNRSNDNPIFLFSSGTDLCWLELPYLVDNPLLDTSNPTYAASGSIDLPRIALPSLAETKIFASVTLYTQNCASGKTVTVTEGVDGAALTTDPTGAGTNVISSNGFTTITFRVDSSAISGRELQLRLAFATNDSTTSPVVRMIRMKFRIRPRRLRRWLIQVPARHHNYRQALNTPFNIETALRASRAKDYPITLIDHFGQSSTVEFERLAKQGAGDTKSGMKTNEQPEEWFDCQFLEWSP